MKTAGEGNITDCRAGERSRTEMGGDPVRFKVTERRLIPAFPQV